MRLMQTAVLGTLLFWAAKVALSAETGAPSAIPIRDQKVSDFFVPSNLGYVVETHDAKTPHAPLIVHIQEAHTNYEGQQHLISILEQLIKEYGLKLILVEGGHGDVGLSYLRGYGSPENRRAVAQKYLRNGVITGEEYLDIVSDIPLTLWGIEQADLYQKNFDAFLAVETLQGAARPMMAALTQALETLSPSLADPTLTELEANAKAFDQKTLGLADYAKFLQRLAVRVAVSEHDYPNLKRFLEAHQLEGEMDLAQVPKEQRALVEVLSGRIEPAAFNGLIEQATQLKAGAISQETFYQSLERIARQAGADLVPYPNLTRYFTYLTRSAALNPTTLAQELEPLTARIREALASTPEQRRLAEIRGQVDLVGKLVDLQLIPEEYARLRAVSLDGLCAGWDAFLREQSARVGLPMAALPALDALQAALPRLIEFYESARARDQALAENAMAKLGESRERVAVIITGGFHSPQVTQLLKARGASLVVVAPRVSEETDEARYQAVVKYKSGRGSYNDVMALANSTPPLAASQ